MKRWMQNVPEREAGALGAGRLELRQRSALIVVDVTYGFTGPRTGTKLADGFGGFPDTIAPEASDWVLEKAKASAFFHTPLSAAEHPAAAMLFVDYVLSEGQQTIADVHRIPTVDGVPSPIDHVETIGVPEEEMTGDRYEYWDDKYRDLVGG